MGKRVFTLIFGFGVLIPILIFSETWIFQGFLCLITTAALYEMYACIRQQKEYLCIIPGYLFGILTPILYRIFAEKNDNELRFYKIFVCCVLLYAFFLLGISVLTERKYTLESAAALFIVTIYIVFGMNSMAFVQSMEGGKYVLILTFIVSFSTDIFAFLVGKLFGKRKLFPKISPKKTVEGAIGGIVFCVLFCVIYGVILSAWIHIKPNYFILIPFAVICSVISQVGDLIFSCIKRRYGIKDFGKILPGHGGICDRFDSVLAVAPFLFTLCTFLSFLPAPFLVQ